MGDKNTGKATRLKISRVVRQKAKYKAGINPFVPSVRIPQRDAPRNGHEFNKLNKARMGYPQQLQEEEKKKTGMVFDQFWGKHTEQEHPGEKSPGEG